MQERHHQKRASLNISYTKCRLSLRVFSALLALIFTSLFFAEPVQGADEIDLTPEERAFLESHPVIRVGNEDDWPPFDFSEHGIPQGYAIEHLELLGEKLGISFEYVNGYTWNELLRLFREGKIDLLPSLWFSESRAEYMLFTEPYLELPYVIITKDSNESIRTFDDLRGKTVAAPESYVQAEVLKTKYPEIERLQVHNPLEGLKAVNYGEADAYIGYRGVVDYLIATRFFTDLNIVGEVDAEGLGTQGLYLAVRQELPLLRSVLQKAMDSVSRKQKVKLAQQWITVGQRGVPTLTSKEKAYLLENPVLKVDNLKDWPPFNYFENGEPKGFCIDYMRLLGEKLGIQFDFVSGPTWDEFMDQLATGDLDLLCDVVETERRRERIAFTEPYFSIFSGIVVKQENEGFASLEALKGKEVIVPEGFYYEDILRQHYPALEVLTSDSILSCLKSVSSGRADAALVEKPVADYLITNHFLTDLVSIPVMDSAHLENTPVSIGVDKSEATLRDIMQKAMDAVSEEEMADIYNRWFEAEELEKQRNLVPLRLEEQAYIEGKKTIRMCIHSDRLPFEGRDESGDHIGIVADVVDLVAERIGVDIEIVSTGSWQESLEALETGRADFLTCLHRNPGNTDTFLFSDHFYESLYVLVGRKSEPYISDMNILTEKTVAVPEGNPVADYLSSNYPNTGILPKEDLDAALRAVSTGNADLAAGSLQMISYRIHDNALYDLKIAGQTPYKDYIRFGVSKSSEELLPILNKALDSISPQEINHITQKWITIRYEHGFDYSLLWKVLAVAAVVVAVIVLWNRKLRGLNRELTEAHRELEQKSEELERLSQTDRLTGLYNRMKIETIIENECERASRSDVTVSVVMIDVDRFKAINDEYGHHFGDKVLCELTDYLQTNNRTIDTLGRWGGEEFLLICPGTGLEGVRVLAEKLRAGIEELDFPVDRKITCSFGIAEYRKNESPDKLFIRVDEALYRAKDAGRNRVEG